MNRGGPLARRTPLAVYTPLHRAGPLNPTSANRRAANALRTPVVNGLRAAQEGRCARCRNDAMPIFGHEVRGRAQGGSIIAPECALCNDCNGAIEDEPRVSCWNGWKASPKWPTDPLLPPGAARDLYGGVVVFAGSARTDDAIERFAEPVVYADQGDLFGSDT